MADPAYLRPWNEIVERNDAARFFDIFFRGAGQVFFQNNPLTGLLFATGIAYGTIASGTVPVLYGFLISLGAATLAAIALDLDDESIRKGLFGFNAALVGTALPTYLQWNGILAGYIAAAGIMSVIVMLALTNFLGTWNVAPLTAPFVIVSWFATAASYGFALVGATSLLGPPQVPPGVPLGGAGLTPDSFFQGLFRGVSQVYFINDPFTGFIFLVALFVNSRIAGSMGILGSLLGLFTGLAFGAPRSTVLLNGLYGYNSVLSAIAILTFFPVTWKSLTFAAFDAVASAVGWTAINNVLSPAGIPVFTSAFVITTWAFLLAKKDLRPLHKAKMGRTLLMTHEQVEEQEMVMPVHRG
jgi:urea transporter